MSIINVKEIEKLIPEGYERVENVKLTVDDLVWIPKIEGFKPIEIYDDDNLDSFYCVIRKKKVDNISDLTVTQAIDSYVKNYLCTDKKYERVTEGKTELNDLIFNFYTNKFELLYPDCFDKQPFTIMHVTFFMYVIREKKCQQKWTLCTIKDNTCIIQCDVCDEVNSFERKK